MTPEQLKLIFIKRYVIAISLIVLLSSSMFIILNSALKQSESTALIVNMSGKQRMLSQRIASLSQQYYWHTYWQTNVVESEKIREKLEDTIHEMRSANEALSSGHLNDDEYSRLSPQIYDLYFGSKQLKKRVEIYLYDAEQILSKNSAAEELEYLKSLLMVSHGLLYDLNEAVVQYQKEGDIRIERIHQMEWVAWILTLITLMLEIIFIFQPMGEKIRQLFQEIKWNQENLEQQIALRTLHLEQANMKLEKLASHDPLTGLKNRLNMETDLENLQMHYRKHGLPYAVVMLDIDWFKKINDTYGHDAGDFVLQKLSTIFIENLRMQDSIYRAGGEEFIILLNRITQEQAMEKIDTLRQIVEQYEFNYLDLKLHCTISGGLYHSEMNGDISGRTMLKLVDEALYEAKRSGRNKIVLVSDLSNAKECVIG